MINKISSVKVRGKRWLKAFGAMAALTLAMLVFAAPAAFAVYPEPPDNPSVDPTVEVRVAGASASQSSSGLAFTGGDVAGMVVIGGVLVAAGATAVHFGRRRPNPAA